MKSAAFSTTQWCSLNVSSSLFVDAFISIWMFFFENNVKQKTQEKDEQSEQKWKKNNEYASQTISNVIDKTEKFINFSPYDLVRQYYSLTNSHRHRGTKAHAQSTAKTTFIRIHAPTLWHF